MKARLVSLYSVEKGVVCSLVFVKGLVGCAKIIYASPTFIEYHPCAIAKVYLDGWVQLCVDGNTELGCHCGKGEYVCKGLFIKKTSKGNNFRVAVWS